MNNVEYAGFWIRTLASIVDSILMLVIIIPVLTLIYGQGYWGSASLAAGLWDVVLNYLLPAVAVIIFWVYKSATPGKMAVNISIVDATTGNKPTTRQLIGRYFAYYISMLPLFLGFFWIAFDKRKQGWHDKLAGTVVIKNPVDEQAAPIKTNKPNNF